MSDSELDLSTVSVPRTDAAPEADEQAGASTGTDRTARSAQAADPARSSQAADPAADSRAAAGPEADTQDTASGTAEPQRLAPVAVVGAGTIGLSWARRFAAHGAPVRIFDPRPDLVEVCAALVAEVPEAEALLTVARSLDEAVDGVRLVQESGPEDPGVKVQMFADLAQYAPVDALLVSSSSAITASTIAARMTDEDAARVFIGHPFNPPHVMPLVEVVPGERTAPESVERAVGIYRRCGQEPVVLRAEAAGFVGNRLQNAVLQEAVALVQRGVVSPADVDAVVRNSLGLRWAAVGPFEGMHMGGGARGFRGFMEHIGPSFAAIDPADPDMSDERMEPVIAQVEEAYGEQAAPEAIRRRDAVQDGVLRLRGELG
ncbi:3-hydroxyacyl-CoA dehydrogenase NAD-binding domain-containing protein [Brevibacterium ihuae]|uniref:3-hydroxyacyl-CoA dehydrogenase NAD-binding domain-containing protein n=1 Tax=Brevibacterium ihuae TaxID=1631743 RepID=UPI000C75B6B8|nr:3-hydroxyacyl-CoA dehydrogenase NAD-binding domain-containing protein [Brevibacterium ihuae]